MFLIEFLNKIQNLNRTVHYGCLGKHGATAKVEVLGPFVEGNEQSLFPSMRNMNFSDLFKE
jgi:hypothetical protein